MHILPARLTRRLQRSFGQAGTGRATLIQAIKASVAALLAWVVAAEILHFSQPFLAPWTAIFIVAATVYRSVCSAAQQFAVTVVAVVLASVAKELIPWELATMFVAVLAGLLIGQCRWFGDSGTWIGITALLILTSGSMQESMLIERLVETAIGATIGIVVNALIAPPVYQLDAGDATARVADELADALDDMSMAARDDAMQTLDVSKRARTAITHMRGAEHAVMLDNESRRLNHKFRTHRQHESAHEKALACFRHTWSYTEELGQTLQATRETSAESRLSVSAMLEHLANLVRVRRHGTETDLERAAHDAIGAVESVERDVDPSAPMTARTVAMLMPITAPARHAIRELSSC